GFSGLLSARQLFTFQFCFNVAQEAVHGTLMAPIRTDMGHYFLVYNHVGRTGDRGYTYTRQLI
ncbi:MAG: hypothetical protein KDE31_08480, partial [Caldilineaceae bacterium]|nr:hypothetical protein [Caldilineaceae bacterium]